MKRIRIIFVLGILSSGAWVNLKAQSEPQLQMVFPYFVSGDGWSVQLAILSHLLSTTVRVVWIDMDSSDGSEPFPGTDLEGKTIFPRGTLFLKTSGEGRFRRGVIEVYSLYNHDHVLLSGSLTYRNPFSGVETSVPGVIGSSSNYEMLGLNNADVGTGIALWKDESTTLCIELLEEDGIGKELTNGDVCYGPEMAKNHNRPEWNFVYRALTLEEWLEPAEELLGTDVEELLSDFKGMIRVISVRDDGKRSNFVFDGPEFHIVTLRFGKRDPFLYSVPVFPSLQPAEIPW